MRPHGLERVGSGAEERGVGVELEGVGLGGVVVDAVQGYLGLGVWVWCVALRFCWVGVWRLVFGVWCLVFGVFCVVFGVWGYRCLEGLVWCLEGVWGVRLGVWGVQFDVWYVVNSWRRPATRTPSVRCSYLVLCGWCSVLGGFVCGV